MPALHGFDRSNTAALRRDDGQRLHSSMKTRLLRRQIAERSRPVSPPRRLPRRIFREDLKHDDDTDDKDDNNNTNDNDGNNSNNNNNDNDSDNDDDDNNSDDGDNPFAPITTKSHDDSHKAMQMTTTEVDNPFLLSSTTSTSASFTTSTFSTTTVETTALETTAPASLNTGVTTPAEVTTTETLLTISTSTLSPVVTSSTFSTSTTSEVWTSSTTSSTTVLPLAASNAASSSTMSDHPVSTGHSNSSRSIAAIAVGSILGVVCVAGAAYLLYRYCTPLKARAAFYRGRRSQRLALEGGESEVEVGRPAIMSEADASRQGRGSTLTATAVPAAVPAYAREAGSDGSVTVAGGLGSADHDDPDEKDPSNPFSDQVPLASSEVASVDVPSLRSDLHDSVDLLSNPHTSVDSGRPPTYATTASDRHARDPVFHRYDGNRTWAACGSDLEPPPSHHPTGLAMNPPTPVTGGRRSDLPAFPVPPALLRAGSGPARLAAAAAALDAPSTPTPAYLASPPRASGVFAPRTSRISQYQPRIRASISPSESASNAPHSPRPMPYLTGPLGVDSRWSRNSSSVDGARTSRATRPAGRTSETPTVPSTPASPTRATRPAGRTSATSTVWSSRSSLRPAPLVVGGRRSDSVSSVASDDRPASVRDLTLSTATKATMYR